MITVKHKGSFKKTDRFFQKALSRSSMKVLKEYAERGLKALKEATPEESGKTAEAWDYQIVSGNGITTLYYTNSHTENGLNIAVLLIYGHGTRNGGYVQGVDFVSPALRPVFEELADAMWKEVTR